MLVVRLFHQIPFAANHPQFVLVGRGQVNGSGGNSWAQVARAWDVQMGSGWNAKGGTGLDLDHLEGVEVGHKEVRFSVGKR